MGQEPAPSLVFGQSSDPSSSQGHLNPYFSFPLLPWSPLYLLLFQVNEHAVKEPCFPLYDLRQAWPGGRFSITQSFSHLLFPHPWHPHWRCCVLPDARWSTQVVGHGGDVDGFSTAVLSCSRRISLGRSSEAFNACPVLGCLLSSCLSPQLHPASSREAVGAVLAACPIAGEFWGRMRPWCPAEPLHFANGGFHRA